MEDQSICCVLNVKISLKMVSVKRVQRTFGLKAKRSAAVILVSAAAVMLIMVFVLFWFVILPVLPQESSVLADNGVGVYLTDKTDIEINA